MCRPVNSVMPVTITLVLRRSPFAADTCVRFISWSCSPDPANYFIEHLCIIRDSNPGTAAHFLNPECRDWRCFNPGISGLWKKQIEKWTKYPNFTALLHDICPKNTFPELWRQIPLFPISYRLMSAGVACCSCVDGNDGAADGGGDWWEWCCCWCWYCRRW